MNELVAVSSRVESLQRKFPQLKEDLLVLDEIREQLKQIENEDAERQSPDNEVFNLRWDISKWSYKLEDLVESKAAEIHSRRNGFLERICRRSSSQQKFIQDLQTMKEDIKGPLKKYSSRISHHAVEAEPPKVETSNAGRKENVIGIDDQVKVAEVLTTGSEQLASVSHQSIEVEPPKEETSNAGRKENVIGIDDQVKVKEDIKGPLEEYSSRISHRTDEVKPPKEETSNAGQKENVIGIDDQVKVAEVLTTGSKQLTFVFICGMSGSGKTKLTRSVFNSQQILHHFQVRAWLKMSQVHQRRDLLLGIHVNFSDAITMMQLTLLSEAELEIFTVQTLKNKRYLIALDDILSMDALLFIDRIFPSDDNGSRILFTTQNEDVALAVGGRNKHIFNMKVPSNQKKLLDALIGGNRQLSVVSICGREGSGKTKLARRVSYSKQILNHFQVVAWVDVSEVYQRRDLLLAILNDIFDPRTTNMVQLMQLSDGDLANYTYRTLENKKYLIVLDDILSVETWQSVGISFPSHDNGSRILLTTESRDVALAVGGSNNYILDMNVDEPRSEKEKTKLFDYLISESRQLSVISICGMEGTGKSKLVISVVNSLPIMQRFLVALVSASEVYMSRDILLAILFNFLGPIAYIRHGSDSDEELAEHTYKKLKGKRYLIVLDDFWSVETWNSIRIAFPSEDNGSRIVLTTRSARVAKAVGGVIIDMNMASTSANDGDWGSLREKAGLEEKKLEPDIKEFCKKIVMRSGGDPIVGNMLNRLTSMPAHKCKMMLQDIVNRSTDQTVVQDILKSSYHALPLHLRPCLLYLGYFSKASEIETDVLYQIWIAEGLITKVDTENQEEKLIDVANEFFDELTTRGWVQRKEEENLRQGRFKSCYISDAVRDFCISKIKEDEHIEEIMDSKFRRSTSLDKNETANISKGKADNDYLRSLLLFSSCQSEQGYIRPRDVSDLDRFTKLRVLLLFGVDFKDGKFPKGVEKLIFLRYLSFRECYLVELSSSVGKILYLQTLDLRVRDECEMTIPNVLGNLKRLKYLYLPLAYTSPNHGKKLDLGELKGLEIVENLDTSVCNAQDIFQLVNLTDFSIRVEGNDVNVLLDYLEKPRSPLPRISLEIRNFDCYTAKRISSMQQLFSKLDAVQPLGTEGHFGSVPEFKLKGVRALGIEGHLGSIQEFKEISSSGLTKIVLNGSEFEDDPMQILKGMKYLKVLVLEIEAYLGKKMKCSQFGFPELRYLKLSKLYNLEEWEVEKSAMKKLGTLVIENCTKLLMLPEGLKGIEGLQKLKIASMPQTFVDRIQKSDDGTEGEDYWKINHLPSKHVKIDGRPLTMKRKQQGVDPQSSSTMNPTERAPEDSPAVEATNTMLNRRAIQ